ncbi:MAG: STM3941 family protein [Pseudomonadota bacterium]
MAVEPRTITASRAKSSLLLLGSLVFVALGIAMMRDPASDGIIGWVLVGAFGLGAAVAVWSLVRPFTLTLDGDGFILRGSVFATPELTRWRDIQGFHLCRMPRGGQTIGFNYEPAARGKSMSLRVARGFAGADGGLPPGWPGSPEELVLELNAYRLRALSGL